ncbi:MAG: M42 family metallopeptidase [Candidatus Micrarchaeota archaeon]|nr:M42 family metallopeptidase [Candidatus Micrarchaeota archaeon]
MDKLLKELSEAFGIPGFESEAAKIVERELRKSCDSVAIDRMGNVVGRKGRGAHPVMIGAHMDEIGLMVKVVTEKGFIRFIKMGGIDNRTLLNQRVVLYGNRGKVYGVIGSKPPHMLKDEEMKKTIEHKDMFIDIGARNAKEVEKMGIRVGDPVNFEIEARDLQNGMITGKALDNRLGCYVMLKAAEKLNGNFLFVGTVQEEVSTTGKGAMVSAYAHEPSHFIAADTAIATDHPECSADDGPIKLGGGPALGLVEWGGRGNLADRRTVNHMISVARAAKIPYQLEAVEGGATDAAHVFNVKTGIPSLAVCVPTRYIHSAVSVASERDIANTINLLVKALGKGMP